ncbi:hypothetical protein [Ensifer sp.]|jgi:hypothetical protein|uniref:hypothetical protein n=1 Tax=Ensifer sp. TaxID=1872086 RepID=UPI002E14B10A|nr:hypothetical protein [Ensifer sp.]
MRIRLVIDRIILDGRDCAITEARALEQSLSRFLEADLAARLQGVDLGRIPQTRLHRIVGSLPAAISSGDWAERVSAGFVGALDTGGVLSGHDRNAQATVPPISAGRAEVAAISSRGAP